MKTPIRDSLAVMGSDLDSIAANLGRIACALERLVSVAETVVRPISFIFPPRV